MFELTTGPWVEVIKHRNMCMSLQWAIFVFCVEHNKIVMRAGKWDADHFRQLAQALAHQAKNGRSWREVHISNLTVTFETAIF